jgi:hypothetical protein
MPEISHNNSRDYLQQSEEEKYWNANTKKQQPTLEEQDLTAMEDELNMEAVELEYINQLNLDKEHKQQEEVKIPPTHEVPMNIKAPGTEGFFVYDKDMMKMNLQKCLSRQDLVGDTQLAAMEKNFYTKAAIVTPEISEASLFQLDNFITERINLIVHYSTKDYTPNVDLKLAEEESELYKQLTNLVTDFRNKIYSKLGVNR